MNIKVKMLMLGASLGIFFIGCVYCPVKAEAGSLWNDNTNWVIDQRPRRVGDIVTVLVDEQTNTRDQANTDISKSSNNSVSDGLGILSFVRRLGLNTNSDAQGEATIERRHYGRTTISCVVTDVLPNGNLVIEGTRDVQTSEETLQLQLIGVIRPQDVNSYNQIRSSLIANAELGIKGRGALSRTQRPGFITQVLQAIF